MPSRRETEPGAERFLPRGSAKNSLRVLTEAAALCRGCQLYRYATQTVFGRGPARARLMFVGEQPGDVEDRRGRPFVGPAGRVFDQALAQAGLEPRRAYVTNAVKHFKFEERGKARLHKRPRPGEVRACAPWLRAELAAVRPAVLVLLGAVASQSVFGSSFRVTEARGKPLPSELAPVVLATLHPSAVLRAPDADARKAAFATLVADLKLAARLLERQKRTTKALR
jgi:uracil-DNA glycosylase family protein